LRSYYSPDFWRFTVVLPETEQGWVCNRKRLLRPRKLKINRRLVQVIEFSDMTDLLIKLRRVRAGQDIDIRQVGPDIIVTATGIRCGDTAAMAAFMEKVSKEHEFLSREIQREINRINRMP
jgi:hypothetical protein